MVTTSEISVIWICMSEICGIISLYKSGPQTTFLTISQFKRKLTAYIFVMKHDIHKRSSVVHRLKTTWTLVHKRLQIGSEFSTLRKFCIPLHWKASQTEISKRNSTVVQLICCRKVGVVPPEENWGPKNFYIRSFFSTTSGLNGEYLLKEPDGDEKYEWAPTLNQNFMNFGEQTT